MHIGESKDNYRTESHELILPFFEKEPDWDKFHIFRFPDGREVYEINLANAELYFPVYLLDSLPGMIPQKTVIQNIMFVENTQTQRFDPLIVRYFPDNEESLREFGKIYYGMIDMDWSGMVDIWTYDERHFISFTIREGTITSSLQTLNKDPNSHQPTGTNLLTTEPCREVVIPRNYVDVDGVNTVSFTVTYHCTSGGGGSSSGGSTGSSYGNDSGTSWGSGGTGTYEYGGSGSYGTVGGTTYTPPVITSPTIRIELIDMEELSDCHQDIINDLIGSTQFEFFRIFRLFYGDKPIPKNYNVKFQYGVCGNPNANACTSPNLDNGWATITINSSNLKNSSDLSFARTILHETLHAYFLFEALYPSNCDLQCLLNNYLIRYNSTSHNNMTHHALFTETKFLNDISVELKNYGQSKGYSFTDQFYNDLSWGGLTRTEVFLKGKNDVEKNRIIEVNWVENTMSTEFNLSPKGKKACD
ncbi:hypothetical protein [Aquiflexum lacus]|uniref:hypothetical protein n=1 Tax=Aquiflexum lacus TaxID=2483805 RepID=UPI001895B2B9|nr:hypothetical protein [Aquiflexum lacus]